MRDISVIGLGLMGAALARQLHAAGHDTVVWNRGAEKMAPFRAEGIPCADSLSEAIADSAIVLICIDTYESTRALLEAPEAAAALRGKVVVQMTSGTPKEAAQLARWTQAQGAAYLDGALLTGPHQIGTSSAAVLLSGDDTAWAAVRDIVDCLGAVRFLGVSAGAASALDMAWLMSRYGMFVAAVHAANLCQSEGVNLQDFIDVLPDQPSLQRYLQTIHTQNFDEFTASLRVWGEALHHIQQQGRDAGINTEIPDFIAGLFDRAVDAGQGEKHVMALIKALQTPS
jgi:3-hydroxyisobutyrate dehydrogenase-like beta-hydroxyacid dehydrogenase